jgi:alpha-N-acetylglucosamine transferase
MSKPRQITIITWEGGLKLFHELIKKEAENFILQDMAEVAKIPYEYEMPTEEDIESFLTEAFKKS